MSETKFLFRPVSLPPLQLSEINAPNQTIEYLWKGETAMYRTRLIYFCLICTSMLIVGLNKSWNVFADTKPKNQKKQTLTSEKDSAPEVTRYYVTRSGDNSDGSSWNKAFTSVQAALTVALETGGGEIWVAKGVYYPDESMFPDNSQNSTFHLENNILLYGGFDTNDTKLSDRDWVNNLTVLSGDIDGDDFTNADEVVVDTDNINGNNAYHVVTASNVDDRAVIDGFVITAGDAKADSLYNGGGGFYCNGSGLGNECSPSLTNITFSGNSADVGGAISNNGALGGASIPTFRNVTFYGNSAVTGGAMWNDAYGNGKSNPSMENVTFSGNSATSGGAMANGGSFNSENSPKLSNVKFFGNSAEEEGGAMHFYSTESSIINPNLSNVIFTGNSAVYGGAMLFEALSNSNISPILINVTFSGNISLQDGGAIFNHSENGGKSNPTFTNVTFSGNQAGLYGGAIFNESSDSDSKPQVRNTIIWNNADSDTGISSSIYQNGTNAKTYIMNSILQGAGNSGSGSWIEDENIVDGGGNFDTDPLFVTPVDPATAPTADGDLRLTKDSPAIDMGNNGFINVPIDLDGNQRVVDGDGEGTATVDMGAFEFLPEHLLTVNKSGFGDGTVTSTPPDIDCGVTCSTLFIHGSIITLTAQADVGSQFAGWRGDCSGNEDCEVTMDEPRNVTANFEFDLGNYLPLITH